MKRPPIPRPLKRDVLIEAGHRCAIPKCHQPTTEIAHIIPWITVKEHTFDNLIALCPNCHTRFDKGEIDRKSMQQYKANLTVLNSRYGDLEQRVLRYFAQVSDAGEIWLGKHLDMLLMYLLEDGLLEKEQSIRAYLPLDLQPYRITKKGKDFIKKWLKAKAIK